MDFGYLWRFDVRGKIYVVKNTHKTRTSYEILGKRGKKPGGGGTRKKLAFNSSCIPPALFSVEAPYMCGVTFWLCAETLRCTFDTCACWFMLALCSLFCRCGSCICFRERLLLDRESLFSSCESRRTFTNLRGKCLAYRIYLYLSKYNLPSHETSLYSVLKKPPENTQNALASFVLLPSSRYVAVMSSYLLCNNDSSTSFLEYPRFSMISTINTSTIHNTEQKTEDQIRITT